MSLLKLDNWEHVKKKGLFRYLLEFSAIISLILFLTFLIGKKFVPFVLHGHPLFVDLKELLQAFGVIFPASIILSFVFWQKTKKQYELEKNKTKNSINNRSG